MTKYPVVFTEPVYEMVPIEPTYRYDKNKGIPWLQRFAFWLLDRVGARRTDMVQEINHVTVDINEHNVHELLRKAGSLELLYYTRPKVILVGPDMYEKILIDGKVPYPMGFNVTQTLTGGPGVEVWGFKIVLVPHMSGFLPVPEWKQIN